VDTAFEKSTYKHTTMGFLRDIQDMPNQYDYSLQFYARYYRPEYTTIILVGDLKHDDALALVKKNFGAWERGSYKAQIPAEPAQDGPRSAHIDWPSPTLPQVVVAFRAPAYSDTDKDWAALQLLADIAFGPNSDIHQRLVLKEQKVDALFADSSNNIDPELFTVGARVKNAADMDYVREQILAACKQFSTTAIPQAQLDSARARARYAFVMQLDSSEAIASNLAPYINLRRTPETINQVFALSQQLTPEDLRAVAQKYFVENNRTVVTLKTKADAAVAGQGAH
jgi:zinc protease